MCTLDTVSLRMAISHSGGLKLDLSKMQDIISMLRLNPTLPANDLRPFLEKYIPRFQHTSSKFVCNFGDKVNRFNALRGRSELIMKDANILTDNNSACQRVNA